jgi:predicted transcriptional regulator
MSGRHLSKAETRILQQYWKLGTCSVREILDSLPDDERVAYTTVQTLVYRLEQKGALRRVKKIGNAQLCEPAIDQSEFRHDLVRDLLDLFGGSLARNCPVRAVVSPAGLADRLPPGDVQRAFL